MIIPVAFICDEAYVLPTSVAITSLIFHAPKAADVKYDIFVLGVGISGKSKSLLSSMSREGFNVTVLDCTLSEKQKAVVNYGRHVTVTAIMRFELPVILPQYDKVLYLDSDILVRGSLVELYNTDITDAYAAAVKDAIICRDKKHLDYLGINRTDYFNSGVMLLNLEKMREDNMPERLLDYRINGKNYYMDQDALNVVFDGHVRYLSPYYNVFTLWYEWNSSEKLSEFYETAFPKEKEKIFTEAVILHLGERRKPWNMDMGFLSGIYYMYYKLSPFADSGKIRMKYPLREIIKRYIKKIIRRIGKEIMKKKGII